MRSSYTSTALAIAASSLGLTGVGMFTNPRAPLNRAPAQATAIVQGGRYHRPIWVHQRRENQQYESYNWSGYAVTGSNGSVTDVRGSWIVPSVTCTGTTGTPNGYAGFWVGIDGFNSNSVEQTGTDSDCVTLNGKPGIPTYYAWFEMYPNPSYVIEFSRGIQPGDQITAEVTYKGQSTGFGRRGAGSQFTLTITDVTQNEMYTITSAISGASQSSAEWIAEAPCCGRGNSVLPLSNFNLVSFNGGTATVQGTSQSIASFGASANEITMVGQHTPTLIKAQPSGLSSSGFTVNWLNAGP